MWIMNLNGSDTAHTGYYVLNMIFQFSYFESIIVQNKSSILYTCIHCTGLHLEDNWIYRRQRWIIEYSAQIAIFQSIPHTISRHIEDMLNIIILCLAKEI